DNFDFGVGAGWRNIVGKADRDLDRFATAVRSLAVDAQIDAPQPASRQVAYRLDPELIEAQLILAKAPTPGLVKTEEHAPAGANELLDEQGMKLLGAAGAARLRRSCRVL